MTLLENWREAVGQVEIRHIDPTCTPVLTVYGADDGPVLYVGVKNCRDTRDQDKRISELTVSSVRLTFWPGPTLAQQWLAAAWAGYVQHEALELVTVSGICPLDPHEESHAFDRGLRGGFPTELTPETLRRTLTVAMYDPDADRLTKEVSSAYHS